MSKTLLDVIKDAKEVFQKMPSAFPNEETCIMYAISEYIWSEADYLRTKDKVDRRDVGIFLEKLTK